MKTIVSRAELEVGACVQSGQVFRWRKDGETWSGANGSRVLTAQLTESGWELSGEGVCEFFRLEVSLDDILCRLRQSAPEMEDIFQESSGLRVLRQADPVETVFAFICSQNNHLSRITAMVAKLGGYGYPLADGHYAFPPLELLTEIPEPELRNAGFGYRAALVPRAARALVQHGPTYLHDLADCGYAFAHRELCTLPGIGAKLADCICLFGLGYDCAVPVDTHIWSWACRTWFPEWRGASQTPARYQAVGDRFRDRFGELAGWAQQYVFLHSATAYRAGSPPVYSERC